MTMILQEALNRLRTPINMENTILALKITKMSLLLQTPKS